MIVLCPPENFSSLITLYVDGPRSCLTFEFFLGVYCHAALLQHTFCDYISEHGTGVCHHSDREPWDCSM